MPRLESDRSKRQNKTAIIYTINKKFPLGYMYIYNCQVKVTHFSYFYEIVAETVHEATETFLKDQKSRLCKVNYKTVDHII